VFLILFTGLMYFTKEEGLGQRPLRQQRKANSEKALRGLFLLFTSLRGANRSRECAPDDRLRDEAIHACFAERWIASLRSQ